MLCFIRYGYDETVGVGALIIPCAVISLIYHVKAGKNRNEVMIREL